MSGGLLGALFAGVSGLDSESTNLAIISNNIANANTPGYKEAEVEFQTLVTGASSSTSYSPGGVTAGNRQLVDQQGLLQSTSSSTDIAIQGSGLFVVNSASNGSGQILYTRAGSFTQDSSGNFVNAAGNYLQAWPLDRNGLLPGAPGNLDTTSSANLSSLETVNVESVAGTASATTTVALSANLDAGETAFPGAASDAVMDKQDATNFGITADTIIVPTATDSLTNGDEMTVSTGTNPTGFTYTYGGYTVSRNATEANNSSNVGSSGTYAATPITLAAHPFTFTPGSNIVTINQAPPAGLAAHDVISISGNTTAFDGLSAGALDGDFYVNSVSGGSFTIALPSTTTPPAATAAEASPFTATVGSTSLVVNGTPPAGLVMGDTVTISGAAAIVGSDGVQMLSAGQINGTHTVTAVTGSSYTITTAAAAGNGGGPATGHITFAANPSNNDTITLNGQTWTFVTGASGADQTTIGVSLSATLAQLQTDLNASADADLTGASYGVSPASPSSTELTVTYKTGGTAGNAYTLASGEVNGVVSGGTLTGGVNTNTGGASTAGGASVDQFVATGGTAGAIANSRLFTGDILDATTTTGPLITTPADFTTASLSFTITTASTGTSTFTYTPSAPNAQLGEFSTLSNLADAISAVSGLSARVVNDQLYVAATNGNDAITFANGSTTGTNTAPPLAGIDWIGELGLANVGIGTNRFSSLQGLADLVNNSSGLTATVNNPLGTADVNINVDDPLDTISFTDGSPGHTNSGSLLAQLGLVTSLNGGAFSTQSSGPFGPSYDPTNSAKNMASGAITPQFSRPITVYDSLGTAQNLNVGFINTGTNSWAVEIYAQPASSVTSALPNGQIAYGTIKFNGDGSLQSVSSLLSQPINVDWTDGASPSTITMNWGTAGALTVGKTNGLSQFNSAFAVNFVNQNGAPVGGLTAVSISSTGLITASFSNGQTQNLYQIPLASFSDSDQLLSVSGNVFAQTSGSGQVNLKQAGNSGVGTIASSSLEQSNVELADQLTQMIVAQRAYEANTKVISTADNLLQALDQIIQ